MNLYKILEADTCEAGEAQLKRLSQEGWDLVTIIAPSGERGFLYYFARASKIDRKKGFLDAVASGRVGIAIVAIGTAYFVAEYFGLWRHLLDLFR